MQQVPRIAGRLRGLAMAELPPTYLAPSLHLPVTVSNVQSSSFSSTASVGVNPRRDKSKYRGVSAINRTGPRTPFTVSRWTLPKPVSQEEMQPRETNPNHGLWAFFPPTREALSTPDYDHTFGKCDESLVGTENTVDSADCWQLRSLMGYPRTPRKELGGPPRSVACMRPRTKPNCYI